MPITAVAVSPRTLVLTKRSGEQAMGAWDQTGVALDMLLRGAFLSVLTRSAPLHAPEREDLVLRSEGALMDRVPPKPFEA